MLRHLGSFGVVIGVFSLVGPAHADTVIDFEGLTPWTTVTNQYGGSGGVLFTGATVLTRGHGLNMPYYPPASGDNVIYDTRGGNGIIRIDSVDLLMTSLSGLVTSNVAIMLEAFDSNDVLLDSDATPGANYVGNSNGLLPNYLLSVAAPNISYVLFHDHGNTFTVDDVTYSHSHGSVGIPLPAALWMALPLLGVVGLVGRFRSRATAAA